MNLLATIEITKMKKWILVIIPFLIIFQSFFSGSHLVWGDSPYFYPENLKELFSLPQAWDNRTDNFGGPQNLVLWLYFPTFLYGLINHFLGLSNDWLIRIIFYFPATILGISGCYFFLKRYTQNTISQLFGSLIYLFNSYFLLLIDGGQVGVALAYGLFPWVVYLGLSFLNKNKLQSYLASLMALILITNIDLRVAILSVGMIIVLSLFDFKIPKRCILKGLTLLFVPIILIDAFWLIPLLQATVSSQIIAIPLVQDLKTTTLLDSLVLFQPHFPLNEFGHIFPIPFYYFVLPLLLIIGGLLKKDNKYLLILFLCFAFLAKGSTFPFGKIYDFLVTKLPFGIAFRDSTKFYIPLIMLASILLAFFVDYLKKLKYCGVYLALLYIYLLILIYPSLIGGLTGVLSKNTTNTDQDTMIYQLLKTKSDVRSLWFPEKLPLAFSSQQVPAISADSLYLERPFASMIDGTYDLYNYLNSPQLIPWLKLVGTQYLFFPENDRKKTWSNQDVLERQQFISFVDKVFSTEQRLSLNYPAFKLDQVASHFFTVPKVYFVLGGEELYNQIFRDKPNFNLANQGFVFLEDPRLNLNQLNMIKQGDASTIILGNKTRDDLAMVYLNQSLLSDKAVVTKKWGQRSGAEYLDWKSELLKGGVRTYDFANSSSVYFSSINGELLSYKSNLREGDYELAIRNTSASDSAKLRLEINNQSFDVKAKSSNQFTWQIIGPIHLSGNQKLDITNLGGFQAINGVAIINQDSLSWARSQADQLLSRLPPAQLTDIEASSDKFGLADDQFINLTEHRLNLRSSDNWLIMTDHYDSGWKINPSSINLPGYAMFNAIYLSSHTADQLIDLKYQPQRTVDLGLRVSLLSAVVLLLCLGGYYLKKRHEY